MNNNPINSIDPLGLNEKSISEITGQQFKKLFTSPKQMKTPKAKKLRLIMYRALLHSSPSHGGVLKQSRDNEGNKQFIPQTQTRVGGDYSNSSLQKLPSEVNFVINEKGGELSGEYKRSNRPDSVYGANVDKKNAALTGHVHSIGKNDLLVNGEIVKGAASGSLLPSGFKAIEDREKALEGRINDLRESGKEGQIQKIISGVYSSVAGDFKSVYDDQKSSITISPTHVSFMEYKGKDDWIEVSTLTTEQVFGKNGISSENLKRRSAKQLLGHKNNKDVTEATKIKEEAIKNEDKK